MSIIEGEPKRRRFPCPFRVGGKEITFETGKLAKQADGAVVVRSGDTMVLGNRPGPDGGREGADFFPLTVDVEERMYAAGKIPGGFFKREGRPTERAILTARMIDRPIRPLWPKGYRNEVQCIATVLSADMVTPHDILAINGVSAALMVSPMPFLGPIGAVRIGLVDGELVVNPTLPEIAGERRLDLIVVGTKDGLTMVEAGANQVPEERLLEALELAQREIVKLCEAQEELARQAGKPKWLDPASPRSSTARYGEEIVEPPPPARPARGRRDRRRDRRARGRPALDGVDRGRHRPRAPGADVARPRSSRSSAPPSSRARCASSSRTTCAALTEAEQDSKELKSAKQHLLYERIVESVHLPFPVGPDGRRRGRQGLADEALRQEGAPRRSTRTSSARRSRSRSGAPTAAPRRRSARSACEVSVSPRTHGSGLFTRGQTQIMSLLTLGTAKEGQRIDDLSLEKDRRYMHHYNFPPFSVGETGRMTRPEAPRHRPRRARPAGARGGASRTPTTSRTRSGSSPRRSSRTARRRWARCAARRSR